MLKRSFAIALVLFAFFTFTVQAQTPPDAGEVIRAANLRGGPGTNFPVVGAASPGNVLPIFACNDDCTWYQIGDDQWIAAFLVTPVTASPTPVAPASGDAITLVSWNVESGGALQNVVADRLASFEDVDIWGLSEVSAVDAEAYEFGAEEGEEADYDLLLGTTGRADRLLLMWDATRFEHVDDGELLTIGESGRAPLWVQLRERSSGQEIIVMVNHLHRSNDGIRHRQATALNTWATQQTLPVVALGDYNFDWNLPNGDADHDHGYDNLTANGVWEWVRPAELVTTQCSGWPCSYNSVLDFIFVAGAAREWNVTSEIVVTESDFPDDYTTPDHRPVMAVISPADAVALPVDTPSSNSFSVEEQEYIESIGSISNSYSTALEALSEQFTLAGQTPTLLVNDEWIIGTAAAIAAIQTLNDDIRAMTAPTRFAAVQAEMLSAANHYDQATALIVEGIDNLDPDKFTAALPSMEEGNKAIRRANQALITVTSSPTVVPTATPAPQATATPIPQPTAAPVVQPSVVPPTAVPPTLVPEQPEESCDPNYAGACIPVVSYDLNCGDVPFKRFQSIGSDPHNFDGDADGLACES